METRLPGSDHWAVVGDAMVSGSAFLDGRRLSSEALADRVSAVDGRDELARLLARANGFFSVVHDAGDRVHLAVDRVRSWPVYYAVTDDVYVDDSAEWIDEVAAERGYDPVAATEYLFTGYVTGRDTLSRDVKQVRPGELVTVSRGSTPAVTADRYFTFAPAETSIGTDRADLHDAMVEAVQRLIDYADGRTVLLGLSGGFDSRLIALLLSRLGYDNTVTYTTDSTSGSSDDIPVATRIADDLGFEHVVVRNDHADYQPLDESEPSRALLEGVGYLSEYPHINKHVLASKLTGAGVDPGDAVHVMGHHLLGGSSFLSGGLRDRETLGCREFLDIMWGRHYGNWESPRGSGWRELFEGRLLERLPADPYLTGDAEPVPDAVVGSELWYWQERLPKYIMSRREFECLGFDTWYPLLDRGLFALFEDSTHRERIGKRVLKRYVRWLDEEVRGVTTDLPDPDATPSPSPREKAWDGLVGAVHSLPEPATELVRGAYKRYDSTDAYGRDPRYGIVSKTEFDAISFRTIHYRPLLLLYLYDRGYFDLPGTTELDRALPGSSAD